MEVVSILVTGTLCIACFYIGAKVGQQTSKGETLELPQLNPVATIQEKAQERREKKAAEEEKARLDALLYNIDNYDGTGFGQKDIPK